MLSLFIPLQAAMGLGLVLFGLATLLLFVVLPLAWLLMARRALRKFENNGFTLDRRTYFYATIKGFLYGLMITTLIAVILFFLMYYVVDLSVS